MHVTSKGMIDVWPLFWMGLSIRSFGVVNFSRVHQLLGCFVPYFAKKMKFVTWCGQYNIKKKNRYQVQRLSLARKDWD